MKSDHLRALCCLIRNMSRKSKAPAAERNKEPILTILRKYLPTSGSVKKSFLEISSGTGQHIAHFAPNFPDVIFQPSEYDKRSIASIQEYAAECPTKNILPPLLIDVTTPWTSWPWQATPDPESLDYIYNANMIHITPFQCTIGLFENAGQLLKPDGILITYGPYGENGIITPDSNVMFDQGLKAQNSSWGVRDLDKIAEIAKKHKMYLAERYDMPANNKTLIWKKLK